MNSFLHKQLIKWVNENFGEGQPNEFGSNTDKMSSNANNTFTGGNLPFSNIKQDISGEDLKKSYGGVTKLKDLKQQADDYIRDIKTSITNCESKDATAKNYSELIDLLKNPEISSVLSHIQDELRLKEQEEGVYAS